MWDSFEFGIFCAWLGQQENMIYNRRIHNLSKDSRPYEKCLAHGPSVLTDAELLAVIIRTGTQGISSIELAEQILNTPQHKQGLEGICHLTLQELLAQKGIGKVKAVQILCIGELSKRIATYHAKKRLSFCDPKTIADYYMEQLRHEEQEQMICMYLDTKNHLLGENLISLGTVNSSCVSPREIYLNALNYHAVHVILVHNHPSGDPTPSNSDLDVTERIKIAGDILGIHLLDHIIVGDHDYVSLREMNCLS